MKNVVKKFGAILEENYPIGYKYLIKYFEKNKEMSYPEQKNEIIDGIKTLFKLENELMPDAVISSDVDGMFELIDAKLELKKKLANKNVMCGFKIDIQTLREYDIDIQTLGDGSIADWGLNPWDWSKEILRVVDSADRSSICKLGEFLTDKEIEEIGVFKNHFSLELESLKQEILVKLNNLNECAESKGKLLEELKELVENYNYKVEVCCDAFVTIIERGIKRFTSN
ncbi:hypothetical protein [Dysgonomonas sp. 520]|uniref:hypothetical protein n=1 Tax=Dysgonomonas sp. 520 TaxID=2302931 RepID=UPI0013D2D94E|nr:hypothetical protein [Dysgonomonas sp. 520]NDW10690.1 hypothetical protein [Dysgonomonas sp. 520]